MPSPVGLYPLRNGQPGGLLDTVTLPDGRKIRDEPALPATALLGALIVACRSRGERCRAGLLRHVGAVSRSVSG